MKKNKCPCEDCISFAMCLNKEIIKCSLLYSYLSHSSWLRNCNALSIHKARTFYTYVPANEIEFIKDKIEAQDIIYAKDQPNIVRLRQYMRYRASSGVVYIFRWRRRLKNALKLVYEWDI